MQRLLIAFVAAFTLAGCAMEQAPPAPATQTDAQALASDGRDIAEAQCSRCHAVGTYGDSPNPAAPTFRTVLSRYRAEVLEQELREGIQVSHPMPDCDRALRARPAGAGRACAGSFCALPFPRQLPPREAGMSRHANNRSLPAGRLVRRCYVFRTHPLLRQTRAA